MARMPTVFLAHGNPMNTLADNQYTLDWQNLCRDIVRPDAVLCISAHWCTRGTKVCGVEKPETIHDFRGFPAQLFAVQYPCPGAPELAQRIAGHTAIDSVDDWGLDHGAWSLLTHIFPQADIPCLQLSLDLTASLQAHYDLAKELRYLRDENVLVIGSGNIVHNLAKWFADQGDPIDWAVSFDNDVATAIEEGHHHALINYRSLGSDPLMAVPTEEHYLPLIYILGMNYPDDAIRMSHFPTLNLESACMRSVRFG